MSDPTQFIVSLPIVHNLLRHQGVIGIGYDLITEHKCSLHQYTDKYKRNYITQLFDSVDSDFVSNKLNSIARYSHSLFISNIVRPAFISTRKTQKTQYQLVIFYDTTGLGELSLDQLIKSKREHSQKFQTQEIISFFWQIADFLMMSVKNSVEYLNLLPLNILCKIDGYYGYNFFISNFGKKYRSNKKLYYNPKDKFYNKTKTAETALSASMFTFGMILLQISSMLQLNDIFENNEINQKLLMKRIEAIKITNDPMISKIIKGLLQLDQTKRLKPSDIYSNSQWLKLRKVVYFPSKIDFFGYKNFQGIIQYDKKMSIGEALDNNLSMIRGTFTNGILQGRGIRQKNDTLQLGLFMNNQLIQGQIIKKNSHFDIGKYKNGMIYQGMRVYLNISNLTKEGKSLAGFLGQFQQGQPKNGQFHYSDGFIEQK